MPRGRPELLHIHSTSKKIKKTKRTKKAAQPDSSDNSKKYQTYTKDQKQEIISKVQERVNLHTEKYYSQEELLKGIKTLDTEIYNEILIEIFSQYSGSAIDSSDEYTKMKRLRRQMKGWIRSQNKPETRGSPCIPVKKIETFKHRLIPILRTLCCRNFDALSKKIVQIFKQIGVKRTSCSKHFWYNFLLKNQDISDIYATVSTKRCPIHQNKEEKMSQGSTEEEHNESSTAFNSPDVYLPEEPSEHPNSTCRANHEIQYLNEYAPNLLGPQPEIQNSLAAETKPVSTLKDSFESNLRHALELDCISQMDTEMCPDQQQVTANTVNHPLETSFAFLEPEAFLVTPSHFVVGSGDFERMQDPSFERQKDARF